MYGCVTAGLQVLQSKCFMHCIQSADVANWIAGPPVMAKDTACIQIPTASHASPPPQTYYLGSRAVYLTHAGLPILSTHSLGRQTSSTNASIRPCSDLTALLPSSCDELGGRATSLTVSCGNTSQTFWNLTSGESLICSLHVCHMQLCYHCIQFDLYIWLTQGEREITML